MRIRAAFLTLCAQPSLSIQGCKLSSRSKAASQHWQTIGVDLSHTQRYHHYELFNSYSAVIDAALLDLIEADPGVKWVEEAYTMRPVNMLGVDLWVSVTIP
ncbi:hypothetical protein AMS68_002270 [Peltaster fructicola]|uniref:Uncharacterized protein n=1 Tax=Peltaster fructicola TaxID=286661 RepID=A0A6H0XPW8_9PEZI|nr:hypothetical protein AMS68_002270 [Peltaster fructicola]